MWLCGLFVLWCVIASGVCACVCVLSCVLFVRSFFAFEYVCVFVWGVLCDGVGFVFVAFACFV